MVQVVVAPPARFSGLAPDPAADLARLRGHLGRGAVREEHLLVAVEDGSDVGRVALITMGDGTTLAYAFQVALGHGDVQGVYCALLDGAARAARASGIAAVHTVVVDGEEPAAPAKRAALTATGWASEGDRLELEATAAVTTRPEGVVEIDPALPEVVAVMAAAMSESLDDYDREQVAAVGADAAAAAYRDMMADGKPPEVPWLAHRGPDGIDGVAAIQVFPDDWCLGYLGVAPRARRAGVGAALVRAMLSATAEAGVPAATASVAVANVPIRATLDRAGFTVRSTRTDFVIRLAG